MRFTVAFDEEIVSMFLAPRDTIVWYCVQTFANGGNETWNDEEQGYKAKATPKISSEGKLPDFHLKFLLFYINSWSAKYQSLERAEASGSWWSDRTFLPTCLLWASQNDINGKHLAKSLIRAHSPQGDWCEWEPYRIMDLAV